MNTRKALLFGIFILSQTQLFAQFDEFIGNYYTLSEGEKAYYIEENCWSMQPDMINISAIEDFGDYSHRISFNSFHSTHYLVYEIEEGNDIYMVTTHLEDEENPESHTFVLNFVDEMMVELIYDKYNSTYVLAREQAKDEFDYVSCPDEEK